MTSSLGTEKNNISRTPAEVAQSYPYQFNGEHIGLSIPMGRFPLFAQLCEDIDKVWGVTSGAFIGAN